MNADTGLTHLRVQHLRCLQDIELEADPATNIIVGTNGAGKTSILEAIFLLGRGKSFRPGKSALLIQHGQEKLTAYGEVALVNEQHRLGLSIDGTGLDCHFDGEPNVRIAELAAALPVQIIDPEVHALIQGGPAERREFIDWGVFHVKHSFLMAWRRYRRALKQRNAALRLQQSRQAVQAWDEELLEFGLAVDAAREQFISDYLPLFSSICTEMLQMETNCRYLHGWKDGKTFAEALANGWERDQQYGSTQNGPHRAELRIEADGQPARHRLSRGQQKLLSIAMVLAQSIFVARAMQRKVTLLVDEPAAELDSEFLRRLIAMLRCEELQLFISTLDRAALPEIEEARVFHVELGRLSALL